MRLIRGLINIPTDFEGCVATIGNFDGVHLGHQKILQQLKKASTEHKLPTLVMMFEPQPREFFAPEQAPARLAGLADKLDDLAEHGVEYVLLLPFNEKLRSMSAQQFMQSILADGLKVRHLIVGDDFRFGCDRSGDYQALKTFGQQLPEGLTFSVEDTPTFEIEAERVSSTRVREALADNKLGLAGNLLGQPFRISGRIGYGRQLGRTIGAPTANVILKRKKLPLTGVYAVKSKVLVAEGEAEMSFNGVANIGIKPTVAGIPEPSLEVHLFECDENLYGKRLEVIFCQKIRDEKKFAGLDELKAAIAADMAAAKNYFKNSVQAD